MLFYFIFFNATQLGNMLTLSTYFPYLLVTKIQNLRSLGVNEEFKLIKEVLTSQNPINSS